MRLLKRQDGVALPVVAGVLLVVTILTATLATQAMRSSDEANNDRSSKRALSAAEAGLRMAVYRLNQLKPAGTICMRSNTSASYTAAPAGGECPNGVAEPLGNNASYSYVVSVTQAPGVGCRSAPGAPAPTGVERCITSIGVVNGVQRRIQTRVEALISNPPLLPVKGIFGKTELDIGNNADIEGDVGSNGHISIGNNGTIDTAQLGPGGSLSAKKLTQNPGSPVTNPTPFVLAPAPITGTELPASNLNDEVLGSYAGYTAATRSLDVSSPLTLPGGDYNVCRLEFSGSGKLNAASGATVRLFVDAPNTVRPGSGCPSGGSPRYGGVYGDNGVSIGQPNDPPEAMQIYVYGWPSSSPYAAVYGPNEFQVAKNNLDMNGMLYAPNSIVNIAKNNAIINGAIAADEVHVKNNLQFSWDDDLEWIGSSNGNATRRGWYECKPQPTNPSDPESGC